MIFFNLIKVLKKSLHHVSVFNFMKKNVVFCLWIENKGLKFKKIIALLFFKCGLVVKN
jgi:hypothetical protein